MKNKRYLQSIIESDALEHHKMAFISGPRQVGKSTLAKAIIKEIPHNFFSWDQTVFKKNWIKNPELAIQNHVSTHAIALDEIHKDRRWKQRLKGLFDLKAEELKIIVTGSARLDIYRKGGDSLLGRYFPYRLNPFSVAESATPVPPNGIFENTSVYYPWKDLLVLGGVPEPFLEGSEARAKRWSRLRLDRILLEDVRDFRNVSDIEALRLLTEMLPETIGSLLSINSLREDLGVAYATVRSWVLVLETLYFGFFVRPYSGKVRRMVRTDPKFYLYDIIPIEEKSKRIENLVALHLLKACQFWTDTAEGDFSLHFLRNKDREEVDFCITKNKKPWLLIEVKSGDKKPAKSLIKFASIFQTEKNFQLVEEKNYQRYYKNEKVTVIDYETFFAGLV